MANDYTKINMSLSGDLSERAVECLLDASGVDPKTVKTKPQDKDPNYSTFTAKAHDGSPVTGEINNGPSKYPNVFTKNGESQSSVYVHGKTLRTIGSEGLADFEATTDLGTGKAAPANPVFSSDTAKPAGTTLHEKAKKCFEPQWIS